MMKNSRLLLVMKYIWENSDVDHPVSAKDIKNFLSDNGISATSKTIRGDVDVLISFGIDVEVVHSTQNRYFLYERCFELSELKLLIDAIQSARFISPSKSKALIRKLYFFASEYQQNELQRHLYIDKRVKSKSNCGYYAIDPINAAIQTRKRVAFKYNEYMPDKSQKTKHNGMVYIVSPYSLIWNNDNYYVIGYSDSHRQIARFRLDRIKDLNLLDIPCHVKPQNYSVESYFSQVFSMYEGPECVVRLLCDNSSMKHIIDKFGEDVTTSIVDCKHFAVTTTVHLSPNFYGWVFSFGGKIKIVSPDGVINEYNRMLKSNMS